jgi:hypothetical protein
MMTADYDTSTLDAILAPQSAEAFLTDVLGRTMLHIPGDPEKLACFFSWDELNRILTEHHLQSPRLRLAQKGRPPEALQVLRRPRPSSLLQRGMLPGLLDLEALYGYLRGGATLIVDAVEQASARLAMLCDGLARCLGTYPQINVYANFRDVESFGLHWDDHDTIIAQIAGRKAWRVFRPTCEAPLLHGAEADRPPSGAPDWDEEFVAGDVLYLPRGWWHAPCGVNEPSLHLTIGLPRPTGLDLLDWLMNRLGLEALARCDLPQFAAPEARHAYAHELKSVFDRLWDAEIVDTYFRERRGLLGVRPRPSLPFAAVEPSLPPSTAFRICCNGATYAEANALEGADTVSFTVAGNTCEVGCAVAPGC